MNIYIVVDVTNNYNLACFDSLTKAEATLKDYQKLFPERTYTIERHRLKMVKAIIERIVKKFKKNY